MSPESRIRPAGGPDGFARSDRAGADVVIFPRPYDNVDEDAQALAYADTLDQVAELFTDFAEGLRTGRYDLDDVRADLRFLELHRLRDEAAS